jgi:hypothetical protein
MDLPRRSGLTAAEIGENLLCMNGNPSPLSLRALQVARYAVFRDLRGGLPGWGRFRSPEIDDYMRSIGLTPHANRALEGWPWCIAAQHAIHESVQTEEERSACPKTASTMTAAKDAPAACKLSGPRPGAVFILEHSDGIHGHAGIVEVAYPDGSITSCEGDTNPAGSRTGDQWGRHTWNPADGKRGKILAWFDFGLLPTE